MENLDTAIGKITAAIEAAGAKYGEDAVDAVLAAYTIQAWSSVVWFVISLTVLVATTVFAIKVQTPWVLADRDDDGRAATYIVTAAAVIFSLFVLIGTFRPLRFAAAFGYPEPLIAAKALEAAGLW